MYYKYGGIDKLKEISIKNHRCYYFDDLILTLIIFLFMKFHTKL